MPPPMIGPKIEPTPQKMVIKLIYSAFSRLVVKIATVLRTPRIHPCTTTACPNATANQSVHVWSCSARSTSRLKQGNKPKIKVSQVINSISLAPYRILSVALSVVTWPDTYKDIIIAIDPSEKPVPSLASCYTLPKASTAFAWMLAAIVVSSP